MADTQPTPLTPVVSGSPKNANAILACLLGIIYFLIEPKDKYLRFYALQATFLGLASVAQMIILSAIGLGMFSTLISFGIFIVWVLMAIKAYNGEKMVLPVIGELAEKYA